MYKIIYSNGMAWLKAGHLTDSPWNIFESQAADASRSEHNTQKYISQRLCNSRESSRDHQRTTLPWNPWAPQGWAHVAWCDTCSPWTRPHREHLRLQTKLRIWTANCTDSHSLQAMRYVKAKINVWVLYVKIIDSCISVINRLIYIGHKNKFLWSKLIK